MRAFYTERGGKNQSEAVRELLRYAIREVYGAEMPNIAKTPDGKPYFPERTDIHFSLSHSKKYVMCAVADCPVGADMEEERTVRDGVPERVCSVRELEEFEFFELWVLKESFIKFKGRLTANMREMEFLHRDGEIVAPECGVRAALYVPKPGLHAAVCSIGELPTEMEYVAWKF